MAKANQRAHHPMDIFNKIHILSRNGLKKVNKSIKQRKRIDKMNINRAKFGKK